MWCCGCCFVVHCVLVVGDGFVELWDGCFVVRVERFVGCVGCD